VRLTTSPPSCAECHEIWEPKPPGTLWATPGLLRDSFTFTFYKQYSVIPEQEKNDVLSESHEKHTAPKGTVWTENKIFFFNFWFCCTATAFPRSPHNKRGIYMISWASFSITCLHQSLSRTQATVSQLFPSGHRPQICGLH